MRTISQSGWPVTGQELVTSSLSSTTLVTEAGAGEGFELARRSASALAKSFEFIIGHVHSPNLNGL